MNAHGVDVFDGADNDGVVGAVAHHFELVLLPAEQGFLDQHLVHGRRLKPGAQQIDKLFPRVGDAAAGAAEGKGGAENGGKPGFLECLHALFEAGHVCRAGAFDIDFLHRVPKQLAVFRLADHVGPGAEQLYVVPVQKAAVAQIDGDVQGHLPAHGGQQRDAVCGPFLYFLFDHGLHRGGGERFDVSDVRQFRVGHNGRRIGVDQHHPVTFFFQGFAGLGARIVKLAGLADHNRTGAQ